MGRSVQKIVEHVLDHPFAVDHIGDPRRQQAQGLGDPEGSAQALVAVTQQWKGQLVAFGEAAMADEVVTAHTPDLSPKLLELLVGITEAAGLGCASGGVVLGVKEQHQGRAVALTDGTAVAFMVLQVDGWSAVTNGEGHE